MTRLRCRAPGKVNACLFVGAPRADGLHPLVSVMQPLSLADSVTLAAAPADAGADEVVSPGVEGPNLAARALAEFRAVTGWDAAPQRLTIDKRVPVAAGMGGGSADAAAALRLAAAARGVSDERAVAAIAPRLGSDVPAAVLAQRCLVTGVGQEVERLPDAAPCGLLVLPSEHQLSTPAVYAEFDRLGGVRSDDELAALATTLRAAAVRGAELPPELLANDLEAPARSLCPSIDAALADVRAAGADVAMVSGSGPTVVGWYFGTDGPACAHAAARELARRHPRAVAAEPVGAAFAAPQPG